MLSQFFIATYIISILINLSAPCIFTTSEHETSLNHQTEENPFTNEEKDYIQRRTSEIEHETWVEFFHLLSSWSICEMLDSEPGQPRVKTNEQGLREEVITFLISHPESMSLLVERMMKREAKYFDKLYQRIYQAHCGNLHIKNRCNACAKAWLRDQEISNMKLVSF